MADQDDSEKTEEPTGKRIQDARRKGNIAKSQEVNSWAALAGLLFAIGNLCPVDDAEGSVTQFSVFRTASCHSR